MQEMACNVLQQALHVSVHAKWSQEDGARAGVTLTKQNFNGVPNVFPVPVGQEKSIQ